ncbi:MAG: hypothetical protein DRI46_13790 [Chloroflexi bacterium]|nr:MAG: hypothetical protein DRI46_13790 [Chloroflexota bacterium]
MVVVVETHTMVVVVVVEITQQEVKVDRVGQIAILLVEGWEVLRLVLKFHLPGSFSGEVVDLVKVIMDFLLTVEMAVE